MTHSNDVDFEPEGDLGDMGAAKAKLKKLRDELEQIKKERQEYLNGWQRCKADSINSSREMEARATRSAELLREELVHDIIPALDSFDMAAGSDAWASVSDGFRSGVEQVQSQLLDALKRHGIERIGRIGDRYDYSLHEVAGEMDDVAGETGAIVRILRHGYRTRDRVLRPAQVFVKN